MFIKLFKAFLLVNISMLILCGVSYSKGYIIGAEDVLEITIWEQESLNRRVTVGPDGLISLPLLGEIKASGLTTSQLSQNISQTLAKYIKGKVRVTTTVSEYNSRKVYVMGAVKQPGKYSFAEIPPFWEILVNAGGTPPNADLAAIKLIRKEPSGAETKIDLASLLKSNNLKALPEVQSGDTIFVPQVNKEELLQTPEQSFSRAPTLPVETQENTAQHDARTTPKIIVDVFGEAPKPGRYGFNYVPKLTDVLTQAGAMSDKYLLKQVRLIRPGRDSSKVVIVDVNRFLESGDLSLLPIIRSGDIIYLSKGSPIERMKTTCISIYGKVNRPGDYVVEESISLLELINLAGGLTEKADAKKVKISRATPKQYHSRQVNVDKFMRENDPKQKPIMLLCGDVVSVQEKHSVWETFGKVTRTTFSVVRDALTVYGVYILLRGE